MVSHEVTEGGRCACCISLILACDTAVCLHHLDEST